jgi:hypothetical protein
LISKISTRYVPPPKNKPKISQNLFFIFNDRPKNNFGFYFSKTWHAPLSNDYEQNVDCQKFPDLNFEFYSGFSESSSKIEYFKGKFERKFVFF